MKSDLPPPLLRLRIDRDALSRNWRALDRLSGEARAGAAVKADAYGLGVDQVVPTLRDAGASSFFVAHWSEVPAVLAHVPGEQVSVLHGPLSGEDVLFAQATGVRPVINSVYQARLWLDGGGGSCDLMIDSGINRLGLPPGEISDPAIARLEIVTCMSHLAAADEDSPQNERQLTLFRELAGQVTARAYSLANSAGISLGREYAFDITRPGLSLYGGVPRESLTEEIAQVAYPQAVIMQVRDLQPGDSVGYNATFTAHRAMRVATIALGYADGLLRCWAGKAILQRGKKILPVLGRISMDMVVVDCRDFADAKPGDWLELPYYLPKVATLSGLSQYELLTLLGRRFSRSS